MGNWKGAPATTQSFNIPTASTSNLCKSCATDAHVDAILADALITGTNPLHTRSPRLDTITVLFFTAILPSSSQRHFIIYAK